jgi:hypothetical protein
VRYGVISAPKFRVAGFAYGSFDSRAIQKIYDSEINVRISWLWDGGIDLRLGDEVNG